MSDVTIFDFGTLQIRTVQLNGEPWFVAKDIAVALGYAWNASKTVGHVPPEWRGVETVSTDKGSQDLIVLSESGLFFFLNRSDKPKALPFQKWVNGEVLPTIRKTGGAYLTPQKATTDR
ncbi:BRO-N domain-containing protein [Desulforhopalus sp. 52FAK]